jgi:hypothetical protein
VCVGVCVLVCVCWCVCVGGKKYSLIMAFFKGEAHTNTQIVCVCVLVCKTYADHGVSKGRVCLYVYVCLMVYTN